MSGSRPIPPPWASLSSLGLPRPPPPVEPSPARLYPNARGCGYPPYLQCQGETIFVYRENGNANSRDGLRKNVKGSCCGFESGYRLGPPCNFFIFIFYGIKNIFKYFLSLTNLVLCSVLRLLRWGWVSVPLLGVPPGSLHSPHPPRPQEVERGMYRESGHCTNSRSSIMRFLQFFKSWIEPT